MRKLLIVVAFLAIIAFLVGNVLADPTVKKSDGMVALEKILNVNAQGQWMPSGTIEFTREVIMVNGGESTSYTIEGEVTYDSDRLIQRHNLISGQFPSSDLKTTAPVQTPKDLIISVDENGFISYVPSHKSMVINVNPILKQKNFGLLHNGVLPVDGFLSSEALSTSTVTFVDKSLTIEGQSGYKYVLNVDSMYRLVSVIGTYKDRTTEWHYANYVKVGDKQLPTNLTFTRRVNNVEFVEHCSLKYTQSRPESYAFNIEPDPGANVTFVDSTMTAKVLSSDPMRQVKLTTLPGAFCQDEYIHAETPCNPTPPCAGNYVVILAFKACLVSGDPNDSCECTFRTVVYKWPCFLAWYLNFEECGGDWSTYWTLSVCDCSY